MFHIDFIVKILHTTRLWRILLKQLMSFRKKEKEKHQQEQTRNFLLLQHESIPTFEPKLEHRPCK